jgi:broad specificity phosphatase PhoE
MRTCFYLMRHAESAPDRSLLEADWPLSLRGEVQAEGLVPILRSLGVTWIVTSPYL